MNKNNQKQTKRRRGLHSFRNPQSAFRIGTFPLPPSPLRPALTLIELMVVIVILMTLVGGVLPVLSPNNEARKIRAASRGLQTYIMQAQARAARSGRPAGIAFRETSPGSGVALEVFQIEIPLPFTGFSSSSTAIFNRVSQPTNPKIIYEIHFGEMSGESFIANGQDAIPPRMTRPGDRIRVGNALFQLGFTNARRELEKVEDVHFFKAANFYRSAELVSGSAPPTFAVDFDLPPDSNIKSISELETRLQWSHPNSYRILRQPVNTSESPYTLPAGVAIDMHASGTEGGAAPTLFASNYNGNTIKQIGILFSPNGSIDAIHYSNGEFFGPNGATGRVETPITDASRVFLLLGRVENVLVNMESPEMQISEGASDEQLAELQERINWLNLDSRWIVFDTRSGRSVVTENTFVDARNLDLWAQLDAAREFARQMRSGSGR